MSTTVKVGQIWMDNDKRTFGHRFVRVEAISETHAFCIRVNQQSGAIVGDKVRPRTFRIRLDRFRPNATGYILWQNCSQK